MKGRYIFQINEEIYTGTCINWGERQIAMIVIIILIMIMIIIDLELLTLTRCHVGTFPQNWILI